MLFRVSLPSALGGMETHKLNDGFRSYIPDTLSIVYIA